MNLVYTGGTYISLHFIKQAISPKEHSLLKIERDKEIKKVFTGESDKFLVIIGPCSADNEDAVCDYICRLAKVQF